jgi:(heptosyl)LPS beta-1,4-glucosyltransferase
LTDPTTKPRERLTACLIVQNEQERLPAALESLSFCDRIVVVDGGSSDDTVKIARAAGAQVIENPWPGYAIQRNVALDAADSDWVLEVDADERISPLLRESIQEMLTAPPPGAAMAVFALRNRFLGGPLGPSAKYPSYRSRLFRRSVYRHDESRAVHEGIELRERPLILDGDLEHELAATWHEALVDMWRYARLESAHLTRPSSPLSYAKGILLRPLAKLAYRTLIDGGWRDGWRGLAKISLDAISDTLVWTLVLLGLGGQARTVQSEEPGEEHFGRRRVGPLKIVALASGERSAEQAASWLAGLRRRGADVALISSTTPTDCDIPQLTLERFGPLRTIHAIETEMHVRPIDALVPVGRRAELALRFVPAGFKPQIEGLSLEGEPPSLDLAGAEPKAHGSL